MIDKVVPSYCSHLPNPKTQSAKVRLAAEQGWLSLGRDLGVSTQILRLGGIYGPGRRLFTASDCVCSA
jgi:nucleoside-diphosphate-sugar epimerase